MYNLFWSTVPGVTMPFSGLNRDLEFLHVNLLPCGQNESLVACLRGKSFGENELSLKTTERRSLTLKRFMH